jgi:hypothetical protein
VGEEPQRPNRFKVFFDSDEDEKSSTKPLSYQYKELQVGKKRESLSNLSAKISVQNPSESSASRKSSQSSYENQSNKRILLSSNKK